jgi:hypothetical protein
LQMAGSAAAGFDSRDGHDDVLQYELSYLC